MTIFAVAAGLVLGGLVAAAAAAVLLRQAPSGCRVVYLLVAASAGFAALAAAVIGITASGPATLVLPIGLPSIGMHLRLDALSIFFVVVIGGVSAIVSLFAVGYGAHESEQGRVLPFFPAFILGMLLVLVADDAFTFLLGWEFMSLASWALVVVRHRDPESRHAGHLYLLMAAGGAVALLFAFGILAGSGGDYAFDAMRVRHLASWQTMLVLALAFTGTGSKAGISPLHVWLPLAHPAAPSHVSALMSGVMTKVAVYAAIRLVFDLMPDVQWWWALPFLLVGISTALIGLIHALLAADLKRLLAFSTIENIGIIYVALGLAVAFAAAGLKPAAAVAMTAALFHVANHALMKSLLFCAAGAVLHATGTRDLDRMGGLIHRMPRTAALMFVGAAAIAALPPLNGFASEWLVFQTILASPALPVEGLRFLIAAIGALLALVAALAAACFVRMYGIAFLGRARSPQAAGAMECDTWSLAGMAILAAGCIAFGIAAPLVVDAIQAVPSLLVKGALPAQGPAGPALLSLTPFDHARSTYNGLIILVFMLVSGGLAAGVIHRFATDATRRSPAWDCGFPDASPATQYSASSFAQPIRRVFAPTFLRVRERVSMPPPGTPETARFALILIDPIWTYLFMPVGRVVEVVSTRLNALQFLTIRSYLSLMFVALVLLLVILVLWR